MIIIIIHGDGDGDGDSDHHHGEGDGDGDEVRIKMIKCKTISEKMKMGWEVFPSWETRKYSCFAPNQKDSIFTLLSVTNQATLCPSRFSV